jgi:hypothetical protein
LALLTYPAGEVHQLEGRGIGIYRLGRGGQSREAKQGKAAKSVLETFHRELHV